MPKTVVIGNISWFNSPNLVMKSLKLIKQGLKLYQIFGKERIRRAAKKIKEETGADIDYGFRVFKVDSSNMKDVYYRPDELSQQQLEFLTSNIKEDRTAEDLLIQVMLEWGLELSLPMEKRNILGKEVYFVAGNSLVACFDENVFEELIREIAKEKPLRVVFQDSSFADDVARINNVMIINTQAFNARGKDARRIYMELDEFQSRTPIDVIAQTNPILIIDEPQSVEGKKTVEALKLFNPLFTVRYSATHRLEYNKVYRLDALDAYNKKLVKKINVKGITIKGTTGTDGYLYLEGIDVSQKHYPLARLEFEKRTHSGIRRNLRRVSVNDNLYEMSGYLEQYKGYVVSEINGAKNTIEFANGVTLFVGDIQGDVNESTLRRIQIKETIKSHLEKERNLFYRGIKVLSLFFIDEVAKYRQYDEGGNKLNGEYVQVFEEEYRMLVENYLRNADEKDYYADYLRKIDVEKTHNGYFSIDKQGRLTNPKVKARATDSEDENAYNLIMKDKERLLSFSEPTRFIFSHSALKEGWDNPNVFQICTLKHSDSTIKKRQEVGRGLRLCVNQDGERIDDLVSGIDVHDVNVLSVVASESYETFARELQKEIAETLSDRPRKADIQFFMDNVLTNEKEEKIQIDERLARKVYQTFVKKNYIDEEDNLTEDYYKAVENEEVILPEELKDYKPAVIELVSMIYSETAFRLVHNERSENVELKLNDNFYKEEFQKLWEKINLKTAYTVKFDTRELVEKSINALDSYLKVLDISYQIKGGVLETIVSKEQLKEGLGFVVKESQTGRIYGEVTSGVRYDLVGKLMAETGLTRKTIVKILTGIKQETFDLFKKNPEEFIEKISNSSVKYSVVQNYEKLLEIVS